MNLIFIVIQKKNYFNLFNLEKFQCIDNKHTKMFVLLSLKKFLFLLFQFANTAINFEIAQKLPKGNAIKLFRYLPLRCIEYKMKMLGSNF